ncbi:16332_t:CDS:1 [Cetraspora pellucida]|uniref:16332_t:CDS:1 n=1 Tax=Cetraspora pellucida TaxID=1433469 RepID=A0ACA9LBH7_9GLOM|nr:16332_t:CDS:1 [Cetraspora pellucida]
MAHTCNICKKEFKTSQGYGNHIKSLAHKLCILKQEKSNDNKNLNSNLLYDLSSNEDIEILNSDLSYNSSNNEELISDINENNYMDEDNYMDENNSNYIDENDYNYELDSFFAEPRLLNNAYIDFMNVIDKYNVSNRAGDAFLKVFKKYSLWNPNPLPKSTNAA